MTLEPSILKSVKKKLGLDESYTAFDVDVITFINSSFLTLHQLGIGPAEGFEIDDESDTWDDFTGGDVNYNAARTFIFLKVRLLFDPPGTSYHIQAIEDQITELTHRLKMERESGNWGPAIVLEDVDLLFGGGA